MSESISRNFGETTPDETEAHETLATTIESTSLLPNTLDKNNSFENDSNKMKTSDNVLAVQKSNETSTLTIEFTSSTKNGFEKLKTADNYNSDIPINILNETSTTKIESTFLLPNTLSNKSSINSIEHDSKNLKNSENDIVIHKSNETSTTTFESASPEPNTLKNSSSSIENDSNKLESEESDIVFSKSILNKILERVDQVIEDIGTDYDENAPVCRICHGSTEYLKSLCECRGTMGLVHAECLTHWLTESGRSCCEICNFQYKFKRSLRRPFMHTLGGWLFKVVEDNQVFIILSWLMAITPIILLSAALCVYCLRQIFIYSDQVRSIHPAVAFFTFSCSLTLVVWYYDMLFMIARAYLDNWRFYYIRDHNVEIILPDCPHDVNIVN